MPYTPTGVVKGRWERDIVVDQAAGTPELRGAFDPDWFTGQQIGRRLPGPVLQKVFVVAILAVAAFGGWGIADRVAAAPYPNPAPVGPGPLLELLRAAW